MAAEQAILTSVSAHNASWPDPVSIAQTAAILEHSALISYRDSLLRNAESGAERDRSEQLFDQAHGCYRLLSEMQLAGIQVEPSDGLVIGYGLDLPFRLAVSGLLARRTVDVRFALGKLIERSDEVAAVGINYQTESISWEDRLLIDACGALLLLIRKGDGWKDIDTALAALDRLRTIQADMQPSYLEAAREDGRERDAVTKLTGLFHAAQMSTLTGRYLQEAGGALPSLYARLDRHRDHAHDAFSQLNSRGQAALLVVVDLLWAACRELVRNSVWAHVEGLGERLAQFAEELASRGKPNPVLELWPSQQQALAGNVLDQYRRAVLIQMPTSAGKTLLAEFLIVQSKALLPSATVAYIVPTRALVNQVTRDLRRDLSPIGLAVEQAVPAYELDPIEDSLLADQPDIIVTTPEKLSLLVRRNHPAFEQLGLVIVDEAHNLGDGQRGARLELLLATIRRDKPSARYLLLSPFLPQADDLVDWLGGDRGLPPIAVNWRPGRRIVGALSVEGRRPQRSLNYTTLSAAGGTDVEPGRSVVLGSVSNSDLVGTKSIKATTKLAAKALSGRGSTLVLCWGPRTAMKRAAEIAKGMDPLPAEPLREAVAQFLEEELGAEAPLAAHIRAGVAYHHSGMSQEARSLVESLVRRNLVQIICGTTTLAQGVNFPISNVLIEDRRKGQDGQLSYSDFWNIVGRAGRAMMDDSGLVGFPVANAKQVVAWQTFLQGEAQAVASQLSQLVDTAEQLTGGSIGLREVRNIPALTDMLQFLAHAMHVGGAKQTAAELEDLLRTSLVYRQASDEPERASSLARLCREYLEHVAAQPGLAALSDQTGFSTPSVGLLLATSANDDRFTDPTSWTAGSLFGGSHEALTDRMRALGEVPELGLGWEAAGTFNPERAAMIVSAWVNGESVSDLANRFGNSSDSAEQRQADFAKYLYSSLTYKASWGLGALQSVCLAEDSQEQDPLLRYIPSMVYFGVKSQEAVWMRMAGLPRVAAAGVGDIWRQVVGEAPRSYQQLRDFLGRLSAQDWDRALGSRALSGERMALLWHEALG